MHTQDFDLNGNQFHQTVMIFEIYWSSIFHGRYLNDKDFFSKTAGELKKIQQMGPDVTCLDTNIRIQVVITYIFLPSLVKLCSVGQAPPHYIHTVVVTWLQAGQASTM